MKKFSIHRIGKLMHLEFLLHRKYYLMLTLGAFFFTLVFMLFVWYKNAENGSQWVWEKAAYYGVFIGFKIIVLFLVVAQSFKELRSSSASSFYLLLPASILEKLASQFIFLIVLAEVVLPFVFWSAIQTAQLMWAGFLRGIDGFTGVADISFFELILFLPGIRDQNWGVIVLTYGIILFVISLLFSGSLFFGKWNVVLTPLSTIVFYLILAGSSIGLSQILFSK